MNAREVIAPCPGTPNCVSSLDSDPRRRMVPWPLTANPAQAAAALKRAMLSLGRTALVLEQGPVLRFTCRSRILGFVDDVVFFLDQEQRLIHFRSASRVGYSDLGVNRRRMNRVRALLQGKA